MAAPCGCSGDVTLNGSDFAVGSIPFEKLKQYLSEDLPGIDTWPVTKKQLLKYLSTWDNPGTGSGSAGLGYSFVDSFSGGAGKASNENKSALALAIADQQAKGIEGVQFGPGTYVMDFNDFIGLQNIVIQGVGAATKIQMSNTTGDSVFKIAEAHNVTIRRMTIDCEGSNPDAKSGAIWINGTDCLVEDVTVLNGDSHSIIVSGVYSNGSGFVSFNTDRNKVRNCIISGQRRYHTIAGKAALLAGDGAKNTLFENIFLVDNFLAGGETGDYVDSDAALYTTIRNVTCLKTTVGLDGTAMHLEGGESYTDMFVTVENFYAKNFTVGVSVDENTKATFIGQNTIVGCKYGIKSYGAYTSTFSNFEFIGCGAGLEASDTEGVITNQKSGIYRNIRTTGTLAKCAFVNYNGNPANSTGVPVDIIDCEFDKIVQCSYENVGSYWVNISNSRLLNTNLGWYNNVGLRVNIDNVYFYRSTINGFRSKFVQVHKCTFEGSGTGTAVTCDPTDDKVYISNSSFTSYAYVHSGAKFELGNIWDTITNPPTDYLDGLESRVESVEADSPTRLKVISSSGDFATRTEDIVQFGGRAFLKKSGSTPSNGSGSVYFAGPGSTYYEAVADNFTVDMFGAVGDGTTNETTAINNAVTFASTLGALLGKQIRLRFGKDKTYLTDGILIKSWVWLDLDTAILKKRTDGGSVATNSLIRTVETLTSGSYYGTYKNIRITGGALDGNGKLAPNNMVALTFVENLVIDGVKVTAYCAGSWAMLVGGKNIRVTNIDILGGSALFEDGVHVVHGSNIVVDNVYVESGDDSVAVGIDPSTIPFYGTSYYDGIRNVTITNVRGKSNRANLISLYTSADSSNAVYFIDNVTVSGVTGAGGQLRNGVIQVYDKSSPALGSGRITNVIIDGFTVSAGSSSHDDTNPYAVLVKNAQSISVLNGKIKLTDGSSATTGFRMVQVENSKDIEFDKVTTGALTRREAFYVTGSEDVRINAAGAKQTSAAATPMITAISTPMLQISNSRLLEGKSGQHIIEATGGTTTTLYMRGNILTHATGASNAYAVQLTTTSLAHLQLEGNDFSGVAGIVDGNSVNQKISIGGITGLASYVVQNNRALTMDGNLGLNRKTQDGIQTIGNSAATVVQTFLGGAGGNGVVRFQRTSGVSIFHEIKLENMFSIAQNGGSTHFATQVSGGDNIIYAGVPRATTTPRRGVIAAEPLNAGSGTNLAGGNFVLRSGLGTGSGTPSAVAIETADAGSSGTSQQTASSKFTVDGDKVKIKVTVRSADPTTSDILDGEMIAWRNTTAGETRWWQRVGATMIKGSVLV
ncbi:hypothetical protein [Larkinella terrae]|uniref:Uncharacterized protein n=1 Tax=Larkinella terrae TaxID=2025311 RepID=A0A7K0EJ19_9BACT|nr:hypothetical protein [Larkinella terrae]MRS61807.1 hypothetical protein [Larkinella terrae]